tara:strand:+ start:498 stop:944 length:447 start_codon:yes stop_codon:yes gene_type:complete
MKRAGRKVVRGQIATGTYSGIQNRIQLFDGKFTTGYKVVEFRISPNDPDVSQEFSAKLSTEPKSAISLFDWADVEQFAWATWGEPSSAASDRVIIAEDNMVVQDLWISSYTTGEATVLNYYIVLEKYEFTAWDGAATMVRNQSQSGPQ